MSFDRRSFLASAVVGLDAFRRKVALFDFKQSDISREESMPDIPNIPLTSHHRIEADGVHVLSLIHISDLHSLTLTRSRFADRLQVFELVASVVLGTLPGPSGSECE